MKPIVVLMIAVALIGPGCSGNSFSNWLNPKPTTTLEPKGGYKPVAVDNRPVIEEITSLRVENTLGGVILIAEGLPPTQGFWEADLVPVETGDAKSTSRKFEFRARPPISPAPTGSTASRKIEAGIYLSNQDLEGARTLTVVSLKSTRSVNR